MTRPATLSAAAERIACGAPRDVALAAFVHHNIFTESQPLRRARRAETA